MIQQEIYRQRIDEAAKKYNARAYSSLDDPYELSKEFERDCYCFKEGADFALRNQWISVKDKEALIEDIPNCLVAFKEMDMVLYSTGSYEKENDEWFVNGVGFNADVTHWMPIPQLEG